MVVEVSTDRAATTLPAAKSTPYKAIDIARYMLHWAWKWGDLITNLKIQKLLYYAQAWYSVEHDGKRLFQEEVEAWEFTPAVRKVFDTYEKYGRNPIDEDEDLVKGSLSKLTPEDKKWMDSFLCANLWIILQVGWLA